MWQGLVAGAAGAVVMTAGEKLEQRLTGRSDSHVPARAPGRHSDVGPVPRETGAAH